MRRNCLTFAAASLLVIAQAALAQAALAQAAHAAPVPPVDEALLRDMVKSLAANDLAGRSPASAEEAKTLDLIVDLNNAAGLEPGNKSSWFQDVPT
ncbi:MAG: peptidase M28, partial [Novosphingobium sp.]